MPIDYKAIDNVVEIDVSLPGFRDSPLIKFEMSYERKETTKHSPFPLTQLILNQY